MSDKPTKRREPPVSYRPPAHLREEFARRVERSGLSTSAFITQAVFDDPVPRQSRRPALEQKLLARLLAQAVQINENLKAVSSTAEVCDDASAQVDQIRSELITLRAALLTAMGRQA